MCIICLLVTALHVSHFLQTSRDTEDVSLPLCQWELHFVPTVPATVPHLPHARVCSVLGERLLQVSQFDLRLIYNDCGIYLLASPRHLPRQRFL